MGDEEKETPDSSPGRDGSGEVCENCGAAIDTSDWYPVTKERDADGSLHLRSFCSEECQEAWLDDRPD